MRVIFSMSQFFLGTVEIKKTFRSVPFRLVSVPFRNAVDLPFPLRFVPFRSVASRFQCFAARRTFSAGARDHHWFL